MRMHIPSFIFLETTIERINRRPVIYAFSFILSIVSKRKPYRTDTSFQHAVAGFISEDGVRTLRHPTFLSYLLRWTKPFTTEI